MRVNETALHEAGHAVVAAYLRVPFSYVTIDSKRGPQVKLKDKYFAQVRYYLENKRTKQFRTRSDQEVTKEKERQITNKAIVILAARAATEGLHPLPDEESFQGDESLVRDAASCLDVPDEKFPEWRQSILQNARDLVLIPSVTAAIIQVAMSLDSIHSKSMSAKQVRDELRQAKDYFSQSRA